MYVMSFAYIETKFKIRLKRKKEYNSKRLFSESPKISEKNY